MLLIDSGYLYNIQKHSQKIEISKLLQFLEASGYSFSKRLWVTSYNEANTQGFYNYLKSWNGGHFDIIVKATKEKRIFCNDCGSENLVTVEKGVDVEIASQIIKGAFRNDYQTLVLLAGDGDLEPAVRIAKDLKKRVVLLGTLESISTDLQCLADDIIELDKIEGIGK